MNKPSLPGDWMENKQNLADGVHFGLSYGILLTTVVFAVKSPNFWWWIGGVEVFLAAFVLIKEFWYDSAVRNRRNDEDLDHRRLGLAVREPVLLGDFWPSSTT